jgi:hypothetical protein
VAEISAATGLQFIYDGTTTEDPDTRREPYQPDRYGSRWAPVLITWSDPDEVPELAGDVVGLGGSTPRGAPGQPLVYVTGQVTLDAPGLAPILEAPGGAHHVRATLVHELAHVVGLAHVDDPAQVMHPAGEVTTLAAGDRAGLAELGAGPCVPPLCAAGPRGPFHGSGAVNVEAGMDGLFSDHIFRNRCAIYGKYRRRNVLLAFFSLLLHLRLADQKRRVVLFLLLERNGLCLVLELLDFHRNARLIFCHNELGAFLDLREFRFVVPLRKAP